MAENTQTQLQINTLRTLQESYNALVEAQSAQATAAALEAAKQAILTAISNIDIDTSDLAKEATLEAVSDKIGTPASGQPSTLFAAIAQGGGGGDAQESTCQSILSALNKIISSNIISSFSIDGYTFASGVSINNPLSFILERGNLISIIDSNVTSITSSSSVFFNKGFISLAYVEFENLTTAPADFLRGTNIKIAKFQSLYASPLNFSIGMPLLEELYIPNVSSVVGSGSLQANPRLILLQIGAAMTSNLNIASWDPTEALLTNSTSLVKEGETFTSNLEKLLYNIRTHIAANLRTDVGNKTITFSSAIKAAIQADATTLAAFPSNWTIA